MSIDTRLRAGLREEAATLTPSTRGWDDVVTRAQAARSRSRARFAAGGAVAAAAVVALLVVVATRSTPVDEPQPAPPGPSPTTAAPAALPAEGSWTSGPAPVRRIEATLADAGLAEWFDEVLEGAPETSERRASLRISGGRLTMAIAVDDGVIDVVDTQAYEVDGDEITFTPDGSGCFTVLRWTVLDDVLRMRLLENTCPPVRGTPDEAFQRALYTTYPFTRAD